jgi:hypothetical protein
VVRSRGDRRDPRPRLHRGIAFESVAFLAQRWLPFRSARGSPAPFRVYSANMAGSPPARPQLPWQRTEHSWTAQAAPGKPGDSIRGSSERQ